MRDYDEDLKKLYESILESSKSRLIDNLELEITVNTKSDLEFTAFLKNEYVGSVSLYKPSELDEFNPYYDENDPYWKIDLVEVVREFRRQGVATWLYDKIIERFGSLPDTGDHLTSDGKKFRKKYQKRKAL